MSKAFWFIIQLALFVVASVWITVYADGEKIDSVIIFLILVVGFRVGELHYKVDKLLNSKDNASIK